MSSSILSLDFYARPPETVAAELLGMILFRRSRAGLMGGLIVETEAYLAAGDPACHTYRGRTPRNKVMFGPAGRLYVYSIHSRHCLNVVTETRGCGSAVLIRAVEPSVGIDLMRRSRGRERLQDLTTGPGKLCEALSVDRRLNGANLTRGSRIWLEAPGALEVPPAIGISPRIGVTSNEGALLRFFIDGNSFVSGPRSWHSRESPRPVAPGKG